MVEEVTLNEICKSVGFRGLVVAFEEQQKFYELKKERKNRRNRGVPTLFLFYFYNSIIGERGFELWMSSLEKPGGAKPVELQASW